jgi:hypothetical protein
MSMHLEGPWLTTTGKRRSKRRKFASAEAARRERELAVEWQKKLGEWDKLAPRFAKNLRSSPVATQSPVVKPAPVIDPSRDVRRFPSRDSGGGSTAAPARKIYTGDKIRGIGTLHKSNAVPVFSDEEAVEIARMRR